MADSVVERLVVAIGYQTDRSSLRRVLSDYSDAAGIIAAGAAATAAFAVSQAAAQDEIVKTARALRVTNDEYLSLSFAFERAGIGAGQARGALRALGRQIGSAERGSAEAVEAFDALGLSIRNDNDELKTATEVLPELLDALRDLPDQGLASAIALQLLGRSGDDLATLIAGGSEELARMSDLAEQLGLTLSQEAGAASERLTDRVTDLQSALRGMAFVAANEIIPVVGDLAEETRDYFIANREVIRLGIERWARIAASSMRFLSTDTGKATGSVVALLAAVKGIQTADSILEGLGFPGIRGLSLGALKVLGPIALLVSAIDEITTAARGGETAIGKLVGPEAEDDWQDFAENAVDASGKVATALSSIAEDGVDALSRSLKDLFDIEVPASWEGLFQGLSTFAEGVGNMASTVEARRSLPLDATQALSNARIARLLGLDETAELYRERARNLVDRANERERFAEIGFPAPPSAGIMRSPTGMVQVDAGVYVEAGASREEIQSALDRSRRDQDAELNAQLEALGMR